MLKKPQAVAEFEAIYLPTIRDDMEKDGQPNLEARRIMWQNYLGLLVKDKRVTRQQVASWSLPDFCKQ